jgi:RNA recognition motif-containing protein
LGSNTTDKKVLDEFKRYGDVIDISIKKSSNGKGNLYGYVIMKNKSAAEQAVYHISKQ